MMPHSHHLAAIQTLRKITFRLLLAAACSVAPAQTLPSAPSFLNIPAETASLTPASAPANFDLFGRPVIPFTGSVRPARNWSVFVSARPQLNAEQVNAKQGTLLASGAPARTPNGASLFSTAGTPSTAPPFAVRRDTVLFGTGFGGQNNNAFRFDLQPRSGLSLSTTASGIDFRLSSSYGSMYGESGFGAATAGGGGASGFGASPFGSLQRAGSTAAPQLSLHLKF